jgi:hypothetical protein
MTDQSAVSFIRWLKERHAAVFAVENEALRCLDSGDTPSYRQKMREKAEMLAALTQDAQPLLAQLPDGLPDGMRSRAIAGLSRFSASARNSLALDSIFYMSALCYPEDHKPGRPDDLMAWIARFEGSDD